MENANPSCSTPNREFLDPKKKKEIESWLVDSRIINSFDRSNEIEYFDTFPTMEELEYHEWLLKYPKPSWVKAKIRAKNLNNVKISCKIGQFLKRQTYIDLESPINVMSKQHYDMVMKDTTSIIDNQLGEVVFGKPFAWNTGLTYDQEKGTITFEKDDKKITFKMPHKMETFNQIEFKDINTDSIPPFVLEGNDDRRKTYYSDSLTLGPEYREDESMNKEIQNQMKLEKRPRDTREKSRKDVLVRRKRSIIDSHLGEMVFGKPFIDETGLVYDEEKGTIMFEQGDGKIKFKMPYNMEIFKQTGLMGLSTNSIPPSAHEENFGHEKTHYYQSLLIGNEYK
ncbi:hypothetical protein Tco_0053229 [Tanacetum coccineum]